MTQRDLCMRPTVAVFGTLRFPPERIEEVLPHLRALVATTYRNDGCIAYDVAEDPFDRGLIRFAELWPDHESLARHLQAPHLEPWRAAARRCGLLERRFTAYDISGSRAV
jgi:quinol monooxygenase YgiN